MNGNRLVSAVKTLSKSAPVNGLSSPKKVLAHPNPGVGGVSIPVRSGVTTTSGAYHQEPTKIPMGVIGVGATISTGLLIGAGISKNIASFLEENELFVPLDDDDDD